MKNKIVLRILRILAALLIIGAMIVGFMFRPFSTIIVVGAIVALFVYTTVPYRVIGWLYRLVKKADYVAVTIPYQDRYIVIKRKGFTGNVSDRVDKHEKDHIQFFNERFTTIQCLIYLVYFIWYGYYDNPIEVRARKAEERSM